MCNPNKTIAAYRRNARVQQQVVQAAELQTQSQGPAKSQSFRKSQIANRQQGRFYNHHGPLSQSERECSSNNSSTFEKIPTTLSVLQTSGFIAPSTQKLKRRRKPQQPGKTAKQNDRHFVIHNYHDHANDIDDSGPIGYKQPRRSSAGVSGAFPFKLHAILDQVERDGLSHIISWQPHGRCFVIHDPKEFTETVMPDFFRQSKLTSFQRQLNLYGFNRITRGSDSGGYYHELFLRGKVFLCKKMIRTKIKGTKFKAASSPDQEPNFYLMVSVTKIALCFLFQLTTKKRVLTHTHTHSLSSPFFYSLSSHLF